MEINFWDIGNTLRLAFYQYTKNTTTGSTRAQTLYQKIESILKCLPHVNSRALIFTIIKDLHPNR